MLDRLEGAASVRSAQTLADLAPVLLVGFDYLVSSGLTRLLAEPSPEPSDGIRRPDAIERFLAPSMASDGAPVEALIGAAWRAALWHASDGPRNRRTTHALPSCADSPAPKLYSST